MCICLCCGNRVFVEKSIALGYTRGHFSALVAMENDGYGNRGAGAVLNTEMTIPSLLRFADRAG